MNLSHYALTSFSDDKWIKEYIKEMTEKGFWGYKRMVYDQLKSLKVGESMYIVEWAKPENYDKFIKIAHCFVSESECCYYFNKEYTIIKRNFDAREMEKTLRLLERKRREKAAERDGAGTGSANGRAEAISAPKP